MSRVVIFLQYKLFKCANCPITPGQLKLKCLSDVRNFCLNICRPGNVDEIDLYVGGISEFPVNDGILGPTFTCIVANQFRNLKLGDRFWYENLDHPGAFSRGEYFTVLINSKIQTYFQNCAYRANTDSLVSIKELFDSSATIATKFCN